MFEVIEKGGVLMYPILVLSVLSLAIFMERLFTLRRARFVPPEQARQIKAAVKHRDFEEAQKVCEYYDSALSRVVFELLIRRQEGLAQLQSAAEAAGRKEADRLVRFQEIMTTIVGIAPLMGLLGTVFGMIRLFNVLSGGGVGDVHALSGGIAEALLTTAAGLAVAIPAQVFYYVIKSRSESMLSALEKEVAEIVILLTSGE